jgi:gas vesicle protein
MNTDHQSSFVDALTQAARENPLAAALIGGGALWLLMGKGGAREISSAYTELVRPTAEFGVRTTKRAVKASADAIHGEAEDLEDRSRSAASDEGAALSTRAGSLKTATAETANRVKAQMSNASDAVPDIGKHYERARSALGELLEQQPLVLGAFGLAIGAGLANAAAATHIERGWAGSSSRSLQTAVNARTADIMEAAGEAVSDIASDAKARAKRAADTMRQVGDGATETKTHL